MNDNIDLTKILKDCPKGWKLYSPILGEVDFLKIRNDLYAIVTIQDFHTTSFTKEGFYYADVDGECILFPSKDQRDWSKFTAPWYKKEDTIECLEEQSKEEYVLKSSKDEDVCKFMQYIEKQLPNRRYDKYGFAKDLLVWLEKQEFYYITFEIKEGHWYKCVCDYMLNGSDLMFKNDNLYYCRSNWRLRGEIDERNVKDIGINGYKSFFRPATNQEIKDWLEKKGEQEEPKVYETEDGEIITYSETDGYKFIEPRFKVGDWVVNKFGDTWHIDSLDKKNYQVSDGKRNYNYFPISKQDEMHLWTIQDAKDGDVLANDHHILILKELVYDWSSNGTPYSVKAYCGIKPNGNFEIGKDNWCFCGTLHILPATKEQRDLLFQKIKEAGYKWDTETKTLEKLIKPKFDPKTLNPFDKVLVKMSNESFNTWYGDFVAEPSHAKNETPLIVGAKEANMVIPYNEETKHLLGTTDEAPEYYRYWED